jgi:hypothetical protein
MSKRIISQSHAAQIAIARQKSLSRAQMQRKIYITLRAVEFCWGIKSKICPSCLRDQNENRTIKHITKIRKDSHSQQRHGVAFVFISQYFTAFFIEGRYGC